MRQVRQGTVPQWEMMVWGDTNIAIWKSATMQIPSEEDLHEETIIEDLTGSLIGDWPVGCRSPVHVLY